MIDPALLGGQEQQTPQEGSGAPMMAAPPGVTQNHIYGALAAGYLSAQNLGQQYMGPLMNTPNWVPGNTKLDPQSLEILGASFNSLLNHPLEQGGDPSLTSGVFNQFADGQAQQLQQQGTGGMAVARGIYQNTIGQFIKTAAQNPLLAAGEILGVGALFMGAGALDVATMGLATPLLWTGFALFAAPSLLPAVTKNIQDEMQNPSDQNLTQLLINSGTAALTIGSPIKAFKNIGAYRGLTEQQTASIKFMHQPGEAVQLLVKNRAGKEINYLLPEDRFPIIPQTVDELEKEVARRAEVGLPEMTEADLDQYRTVLKEHDQLAAKISGLEMDMGEKLPRGEGGKFRKREDYLNEVKQKLQETQPAEHEQGQGILEVQKTIAHRYGYRLATENSMGRISKEEFNQIDRRARHAADMQFRGVWGILHYAGEGHGWDGAPDGAIHSEMAANWSEAMARGDAAGGVEHAQRILSTNFIEAAKALGIKEERMDHIYAAIEGHRDPKEDARLWESLSPHEKLLAEKLHITFGIMTNYAFKHGHIEAPMARYVPRMVTHDDPEMGRGVRATTRQQEGLVAGTRAVQNRSWSLSRGGDSVSEWDVANELQDAEFSGEEGLPSIADRLKQTHEPWLEFNASQQTKRANYAAFAPLREANKDTKTREIGGKQTTFNQFLHEKRREFGNYLRASNKMEENLKKVPGDLEDLGKQITQGTEDLKKVESDLERIKGWKGMAHVRGPLVEKAKQLRNENRKNATAQRNLIEKQKEWEKLRDKYNGLLETKPAEWAKAANVHKFDKSHEWFDTRAINRDELKRRLSAQPGGKRLLSGHELMRTSFGRYIRQMNQSRYRPAWTSIAVTRASDDLKLAYGVHEGSTLAEIRMKSDQEKPVALTTDVPLGDAGTDPHQALLDAGYEMVMPAMGRKGQLNYQPAIFGRKDIVGPYREMAQNAKTAGDLQSAFTRSVYNVTTGIPKRMIMGSPAWHGKNVAGHAITLLFQHPGLAGNAIFDQLKSRFTHPERYYETKMQHWMDGGVPANKFNVHDHLNWLEQEMSGQRNFGYSVRHPLGALGHAHAEAAEGWFWKTVDDMGTAAYVAQKAKLMQSKPWMKENMAGMLSAEYANNVAGMVNPLYMSKLWRWGRQMALFAPNWWTTFARVMVQSLPGSTRLSSLLKDTRFKALDPVKINSLDIRHRTEMVRIHRSYFITMMAAAMASHDLMNYVLSGHHVWENNKGHEWDLEMDREYAPKLDPKTGQTKHAHLHSIQLYSQIADLMNGMGVGHDWGFAHLMSEDENYKKADMSHKMAMLGNSLGEGANNVAAGKISTSVNLGVGAGVGVDPYSLLRDHQANEIPRWEALIGTLPGGYYAQRQLDQYRRAATRAEISGDWSQAEKEKAQILPAGLKSAALQSVGLPSMFYSGDEPTNGYHFLTERETQKYLKSRQNILLKKKQISEGLMKGDLKPNDWVIQNEMQTQSYLQLLSDTFGEQSTGHSLFNARRNLFAKYNLDDMTLSSAERTQNLQQFEADWEDQLHHASTEAKSMWWETHTSMWTDADYLYWMTSQMRNAVQNHIDGEGGRHIRAAQARLSGGNLPLDPAATDALRQQDPYLWTYHQVMSEMAKHSMIGALTSAYHNPYSNFSVFPDDQGPAIRALDEAGALKGGSTLAATSTMRKLAASGRGIAQEAAPEGGQATELPGVQQAAGGLSAEAARQILENDADATPAKKLPPEMIAYLEKIANG